MKTATTEFDKLRQVNLDAGLIFSGQKSGTTVRGYEKPTAFTPKINPDYVFHESVRDLVVWFIAASTPLYLCGPCGCGKSSQINQLAARLNYPVFEVTGHNRLEFQDLTGHHVIQNGNMRFEYGPLALAMKYGGLFLLNELDLLEPSTATGFNGILDGQPLCIPENGGEIITPHSMFRFAATANTNGGSDETGLYQGTLRMNMALMDRFTVIEVSYPPPEAELLVLEKTAPTLPATIRTKMVEYANEIRRLFMGEDGNSYNSNAIEITFSTRTLLRWADLTIRYQPLAAQGIQPLSYALDRALGFRATRETRAMLHELVQRMFSLETMPPESQVNYSKSGEVGPSAPYTTHFTKKLITQNLASLIVEVSLVNSSLSFDPEISLECPTNSGGKFWRGLATNDCLKIWWGKKGAQGGMKTIPREQCRKCNPVLELRERSVAKIDKGYDLIPNETKLP